MKKFSIILVYFVLVIGTLQVFWQVRNFDFINYDDPDYQMGISKILKNLNKELANNLFGTADANSELFPSIIWG